MSTQELRDAAALMRERAAEAAATESWDWRSKTGATWWGQETRAGRYIQSWHPAVALAVADWLDGMALSMTSPSGGPSTDREEDAAFAVSRAYLGSAS